MSLSQYYTHTRYYRKNKEEIRRRWREYYKKNRDRCIENSKRNRVHVTKAEIDEMKKRYPFCFVLDE